MGSGSLFLRRRGILRASGIGSVVPGLYGAAGADDSGINPSGSGNGWNGGSAQFFDACLGEKAVPPGALAGGGNEL